LSGPGLPRNVSPSETFRRRLIGGVTVEIARRQ
jgi:hypothetical protein